MIESEDGTHLSPEAAARGGTGRRGLRIPDLCSGRPVLFLSLIGVLLALCLVLFESGLNEFEDRRRGTVVERGICPGKFFTGVAAPNVRFDVGDEDVGAS